MRTKPKNLADYTRAEALAKIAEIQTNIENKKKPDNDASFFMHEILDEVERRFIAEIRERQNAVPGLKTDHFGHVATWGGDLTPGIAARPLDPQRPAGPQETARAAPHIDTPQQRLQSSFRLLQYSESERKRYRWSQYVGVEDFAAVIQVAADTLTEEPPPAREEFPDLVGIAEQLR